jgi:hypothetical protein
MSEDHEGFMRQAIALAYEGMNGGHGGRITGCFRRVIRRLMLKLPRLGMLVRVSRNSICRGA